MVLSSFGDYEKEKFVVLQKSVSQRDLLNKVQ